MVLPDEPPGEEPDREGRLADLGPTHHGHLHPRPLLLTADDVGLGLVRNDHFSDIIVFILINVGHSQGHILLAGTPGGGDKFL